MESEMQKVDCRSPGGNVRYSALAHENMFPNRLSPTQPPGDPRRVGSRLPTRIAQMEPCRFPEFRVSFVSVYRIF